MEIHVFRNFLKRGIALLVFAMFLAISISSPVEAGIAVIKEGGKSLKMGGRIHLQYHLKDPEGGEKTDDLFLRRFRTYIEGSVHKDWSGKFQVDFGKKGSAKDDDEVEVKDAYLEYRGFKNHKLLIGNAKVMFSPENLISSKKQQTVTRTFVGEHNYGSVDRNLGLHLTGQFPDKAKHLTYALNFGSQSVDPDAKKLDFDTPVNNKSDWNQGWTVGGRVDYHPFGLMKWAQGDFKRKLKARIGIAAFKWQNDDDNNTHIGVVTGLDDGKGKPDVDSVTGLEVSAALKMKGFSVDAAYNTFDADTVDDVVSAGIYKNGATTLENFAIEGGYMVIPGQLEAVVAYESQDADGYAKAWTRSSFGLNWFFVKKHDVKLQVTYRIGENKDGKEGNDLDDVFMQMQYVF